MKKPIIILGIISLIAGCCSGRATKKQKSMLKSGIVELTGWHWNETEHQLDNIEYTSVSSEGNGFYTIKICFQSAKDIADFPEGLAGHELLNLLNDRADYFTFKIKNIKTEGNLTTAKLTDISITNADMVYLDDEASGTIEINRENNLVKVMFQHRVHNNAAAQHVIIWKQ